MSAKRISLFGQAAIVLCVAILDFFLTPVSSFADQVIADDLIVQMSECVGTDCANGENFGFDTIRLKENNLRIKFQDTSNSGSFPSTDWQITANDSTNGGANKFSIDDIDSGRTPFTIEASAPSNSLYVDDGGRVGLGTSTPSVELHIVDGDTPTMRLQQDGSSGFTPQTWDVAGNEAGFFVRDVTNGSQLAFRILPGADSESLVVAGNNNIGIGTLSPSAPLHVKRTSSGQLTMVTLENNGAPQFEYTDTSTNVTWRLGMNNGGDFVINDTADVGTAELRITTAGQLYVNGNGTPMNVPDYVFKSDYPLMSLEKLETFIKANGHLPNVQSVDDVKQNGGVNLTALPLQVLEKVEELTLHTIAQQKTIDQLAQDNARLKARLEALEKQSR